MNRLALLKTLHGVPGQICDGCEPMPVRLLMSKNGPFLSSIASKTPTPSSFKKLDNLPALPKISRKTDGSVNRKDALPGLDGLASSVSRMFSREILFWRQNLKSILGSTFWGYPLSIPGRKSCILFRGVMVASRTELEDETRLTILSAD